MNKLMGFYELKNSKLPTIPWMEYTGGQELAPDQLWTIRTAVYKGNDQNLPRYVGISGGEAIEKAKLLYNDFSNKGIVIYYPYFIAEKSGTLNVYSDKTVIEAVKEDLWNLVTNSDRDVTIIQQDNEELSYNGNKDFLSNDEVSEILSHVPVIKLMFRGHILEGKSILLEWSFAYNCDINKNRIDEKYFVFYEVRVV